MSQGGGDLWGRLSHLSPHIEVAALLRDLRQLDREFEHLPSDQRLLFLAEALQKRNLFSSFRECLEIAELWMNSDLQDQGDPSLTAEAVRASHSPLGHGAGTAAVPISGVATAAQAPKENEESRSVGGREKLIRELIRMIVGQIESSCGWSERELVSVERDGVVHMLELLRVLRAEPEFFDYALESLRELLDRIEAERKARVRAIRQEAKQEAEGAEGSGRRSAGSSGDEF